MTVWSEVLGIWGSTHLDFGQFKLEQIWACWPHKHSRKEFCAGLHLENRCSFHTLIDNLCEVTSLTPHELTVPGTRSEALCRWLWKLTDPSPNQWSIRSLNPRYSGWTSGRHWWRLHPKPCNSYSSSRCHMTQWRQHIITWPRGTYNNAHPPLVHTTPLVSEGDGHRAVLAEAEVGAVVMVVRSDPSNPHTGRVLTREYSDRMIVLQETNTAVTHCWPSHSQISFCWTLVFHGTTWGWVKAVHTDNKNYNPMRTAEFTQSSHRVHTRTITTPRNNVIGITFREGYDQ